MTQRVEEAVSALKTWVRQIQRDRPQFCPLA
jgi:hypothetical protein